MSWERDHRSAGDVVGAQLFEATSDRHGAVSARPRNRIAHAIGELDLDDVGTVFGHDHPGQWTRDHLCGLDDADAGQRARQTSVTDVRTTPARSCRISTSHVAPVSPATIHSATARSDVSSEVENWRTACAFNALPVS